jgi:hypothetical protein
MTSRAKIAANRRNALRSTGPRTDEGKASSRRNALEHGLSIPVSRDPAVTGEMEAMAAAFAPLLDNSHEAARLVAEMELQLVRIQRRRAESIDSSIEHMNKVDGPLSPQTRDALGAAAALVEIAAFDRYEQRALSRLRKILKGKKAAG